MAYTIITSGCHINPAATLGFLASRKLASATDHVLDRALAGGLFGGLIIWIIVERGISTPRAFAANGWGADIGSKSVSAPPPSSSLIFTALFVFVACDDDRRLPDRLRWSRRWPAGDDPPRTIPVDNTSVNPAAVSNGGSPEPTR
jgi:glycerol uptake facilitator-like aquaporin